MSNSDILSQLDAALSKRRNADPGKSYTASLYAGGTPAITAKITEEAAEVVEAAAEADDGHLVHEIADLWFHTMVLLQARGLNAAAVQAELARRFGVSGIEEKAARGSSDTPAN
ncbi:phosphoribosyl-ATP pyrophosphatase [Salinisphaera shabanensis T35B1]|uniref:Phosphoribosyl-ATP pyrophosphatase n=1 Tax=Salinisphaera shabanensis E1L3A TaxID=1033802 RepID=U2EHZ4_9GAMM|nr:phosphoribosyl-ATP diphosphatase [Salinisphaera shabanensis]ERJ17695.1 Phosphoribosyl-ATP pyrophosphatase protein [Salinisphaera shabanensis E1L3A]